jgi:hypothetical protein
MARQDFIDQLKALNYTVEDRNEGRLVFPYMVPVGRFIGQEIRLGFEVADDFPLNPPGGLHLAPRLMPLTGSTPNPPAPGINESPSFGPEWQYWSRPFPDWDKTDRTVRAYLAHIRHIFDTI